MNDVIRVRVWPRGLERLLSGMMALALLLAPLSAVSAAPVERAEVQQASPPLRLTVVSARTEPNRPQGAVTEGDAVPEYQYLINVDNTGNPVQARYPDCYPYLDPGVNQVRNPAYPDSCDWPSIRAVPGAAPIYAQGTQDDFNGVLNAGLTLPPGRYLVSVVADGYKIGGAHFSVPLPGTGEVTVALQPHPLPPATMRIRVFEDVSPVNGQFDAPAENGLAGFRAVVNDPLGQISTDLFGNPLCTTYDANGDPNGQTNCLVSDANGDIVIPNLGPNRYDVTVSAPNGQTWLETTTLEGSPSWDTWLQEGGTGLDNEFVVAGEPFPWTVFGFVRPTDLLNTPTVTGGLRGTVVSASVYLPQSNGLPYYGGQWGGLNGARVGGPIANAWVALSDLQNGDTAVYVGPANPDGTFEIANVPDGNYFFTYWDINLHYILDWMQVTVADGQIYDMGTPFLTGWFTRVDGYVFNDANTNGRRDPGEPGIPGYTVVLKDRDNTEIDRMTIAAVTDATGYYVFDKAYPMGSWMILEAYNDRYTTTGITYQVENQPTPTTVLGNGVDVGVLPILGQGGRLDWGVRPYAPGTNGGIVGTVFYDTTRNELDARYQAVEGWAPGIPGLTLNLYRPVLCGTTPGAPCDLSGMYELDPARGNAIARGPLLNTTTTEVWEQPVDCVARDANGDPLTSELLLAPATGEYRCLEAPLTGTQFQSGFATLDGNWGFTEIAFDPTGQPLANPQPLPAGDYLVEVVVPTDALGRPVYQVVREEDINVFGGDEFVPQVPPPACAGALHTVDVAGIAPDGAAAVNNPSFVEAGGSPFEGQARPLCDVKLITLSNGRSIAPAFNLFTPVPIPGKWKGYIIDDLTLATDPKALNFGEKAGIGNMPIGVYDFNNRLVTTITSDPNGVYEVLLPSTTTINCPTPTGICAGTYYLLGNDPGQPDRPNPNYNPQYRTIGASFEIWPGAILPSDLAPTQIGVGVLAPGSQFVTPADCSLDAATPQLMAVDRPYVPGLGNNRNVVIQGQGFGATRGVVTLNEGLPLPVSAWSDTAITVRVPESVAPGGYQLSIRAANGQSTVNGLTLHVRGGTYARDVYEVGPGRTYATIQSAIDAAAARPTRTGLVVVYPGAPALWNPTGVYFENVVMYARVKLQGVGPGGVRADNSVVPGAVIDGRGVAGDTAYGENWRTFVTGLTWAGNQAIYEGAVIYVVADDGEFTQAQSFPAGIDGFAIQGGDQQGFPNQLAPIDPTVRDVAAIQGGGIFVNGYARYLLITNNIIRSNGGAYAGAIRLGTPHLAGALNDNQNDFVRIAYNRILANGGTNLAGAIGLFSGAAGYEVDHNDVCGNFSAEYGGGISHYGLSPNGSIHHNRIYFNRAYDEGGGIMIAGELQADPAVLTPGAGPVTVYNNLLQANLSNDDGGGLRFLMAGNFPYSVSNNLIVNNVSTHEGGGVSLNDAPNVRVFNNTIMRNITTATAVTSNGAPAPAGLATARNSALLQATLPVGAPVFSNPVLFNNLFWDNRAGAWTGAGVAGIGQPGDPSPIFYWDLGAADGSGEPAPTNSLLQTSLGTVPSATNLEGTPPAVIAEYPVEVSILPWRGNPRFVDPILVAAQLPVTLMGNYRLAAGSPAVDAGAATAGAVPAPRFDVDDEGRPQGGGYDIGADERTVAQTAFPATAVVDAFNRANGGLGTGWAGDIAQANYRIFSNQVQVRNQGSVWRTATYGANQEAYFTFTKVATATVEQALILKFLPGIAGANHPLDSNASAIVVAYDHLAQAVVVYTKDPVQQWIRRTAFPAVFANGQVFGARFQANGVVSVFQNGVLIGQVSVLAGPNPWPLTYVTGGGRIGVMFGNPLAPPADARFDNFGGGTMP